MLHKIEKKGDINNLLMSDQSVRIFHNLAVNQLDLLRLVEKE